MATLSSSVLRSRIAELRIEVTLRRAFPYNTTQQVEATIKERLADELEKLTDKLEGGES